MRESHPTTVSKVMMAPSSSVPTFLLRTHIKKLSFRRSSMRWSSGGTPDRNPVAHKCATPAHLRLMDLYTRPLDATHEVMSRLQDFCHNTVAFLQFVGVMTPLPYRRLLADKRRLYCGGPSVWRNYPGSAAAAVEANSTGQGNRVRKLGRLRGLQERPRQYSTPSNLVLGHRHTHIEQRRFIWAR